MTFTRARDLLAVGLIALALSYGLISVFYNDLPPRPTFASLTLLVLAVLDVVLGFGIRSRVRRSRAGESLQPMVAVRAVALAKASSLLGALLAGVWLGLLGYSFPQRGIVPVAGQDMLAGSLGLVFSLLLVGGGLWLEYCCRNPDDEEDPPPEDR